MNWWDADDDARFQWRTMINEWEEARRLWYDSVALHFEQTYWEPFEQETVEFLGVVREFMLVLDDVEEIARRRW